MRVNFIIENHPQFSDCFQLKWEENYYSEYIQWDKSKIKGMYAVEKSIKIVYLSTAVVLIREVQI